MTLSVEKALQLVSMTCLREGRDDFVLKLSTEEERQSALKQPLKIQGGSEYRMKTSFKLGRDVSGLKYQQKVKIKSLGLKVYEINEEVDAKYSDPNEVIERISGVQKAPGGFLFRGEYLIESIFSYDVTNENRTKTRESLEWKWSFMIL